MAKAPFKVVLSGDFKKADGSPTFPDFDISPLLDQPGLDCRFLERVDEIRAEQMADVDALILLTSRFTKNSIHPNGRLAMVARFGVGYDSVDVQACTAAGIAVVITPDGVRRPVAVAILTFMLALSGRMMVKDLITRDGPAGWAKKSDHMGVGLIGRTLGSVGIGNIGAEMFRMAMPLDMKFIAHDPYANVEVARSLGIELVTLDEVFRRADFVTVNCPLSDSTRHLVNAERLALMRPTAFLINTARGPIVDQKALTKALQERRIAGAGLDVLDKEPPDADDPILKLDNVIFAPHALCWTDQCFAGIGACDVRAALDLMQGKEPTGVVNKEVLASPVWRKRLESFR